MDLVKLLRGETYHFNMLAHIDGLVAGAAEKALASIATGTDPPDPAAKAMWRILMSEQHPLSDPDNLARAVMLGSAAFAEEVLEKGYRYAAANIRLALSGLAELVLHEGLLEVYRVRVRSILTAPGLLLPNRCRLDPAALQAMGYSVRPEPVYIPLRSHSDAIVRHLHRPTGLEGLQGPEDVSANLLAAAIMQAVLENRYTLAIYATADALAGGGGMTVAGPARMPLVAGGEQAAKALDIVEQLFRAAGHRVKKRFLERYLLKIGEVVKTCEELVGRQLDGYDLRGFWEQDETVQKVRADAIAVERGGEPENIQELVKKEPDPFKVLELLHLYMNSAPYFTADQARRLERVAVRATALALLTPHTPKTTHTDWADYVVAKRRLSLELTRTLTANLVPAQAHVSMRIRGIDRLAWAVIVNMTR